MRKAFCTLVSLALLLGALPAGAAAAAPSPVQSAVPSAAPSAGRPAYGPAAAAPQGQGPAEPSFNVRAHGAKGDGSANDTAAIQAAVNAAGAAGGGVVFIPRGTYRVTGLRVSSDNVRLVGEGWASRIAMSQAAGDTLLFSNGTAGITTSENPTYLTGAGAENLRFEPAVARTSGAEVAAYRFNKLTLNDLGIVNVYQGIQIGRASDLAITAQIERLRIYQMQIGVKAVNAIELYGRSWALNQHTPAANAVGVWVSGGCEGFNLLDVDAVNSVPAEGGSVGANSYTLLIRNDAGTATPARFNKFTSCFWDGGSTGARLEDGDLNTLVGNWFHGWTETGLTITGTAAHTKVIGGESVRSGWHGVFVNTSGKATLLQGLSSVNSGVVVGNADGFELHTGASDVTLDGCFAGTVASITPRGSQAYGVKLHAGVTNVTVSNSKFAANVGGAYSILSTSPTNVFRNNTTEWGAGDFVSATHNAAQAVPDGPGVSTALNFNTLIDNPNSMHETSVNPSFFVALTPGNFDVKCSATFAANPAGHRQLALVRYNADGSGATTVDYARTTWALSGAVPAPLSVGAHVYMNYGQYVRCEAQQTSGRPLDVVTTPVPPRFTMTKVN